MINTVTTWFEILGCIALAAGFAYLAGEYLGIAWGLISFGAAILFMSAAISAAQAGRKKGGSA